MGDDWARPVVHWEIEAVDAEAQRAFYASSFNWEIGDGPIMQIPAGIGGPEPGPGRHLRQSDRSRVTLYVQVRDLRASLLKAADLGATVVIERFDIPGGATLAAITDPEGNRNVGFRSISSVWTRRSAARKSPLSTPSAKRKVCASIVAISNRSGSLTDQADARTASAERCSAVNRRTASGRR